jgi:hypothetical protein
VRFFFFFWSRKPFPHPLRRLHLGFNIIPIHPRLFSCYDCSKISHTHTRCSSSSFIVTLSLIRRTACARAQFSRCSSTTNTHSETGQMAVCRQNLPLGALNSRSAPSMLVGALFKKFGLFLNTPRILYFIKYSPRRRIFQGEVQILLIRCVCFIPAPILAALSHRRPASAGTSCDRHADDSDERNSLYS